MGRTLDEIRDSTRRFIARIEMPHFGNGDGRGKSRAAALVERAAERAGTTGASLLEVGSEAGSAVRDAGSTLRDAGSTLRDASTTLRDRASDLAAGQPQITGSGIGIRSRIDRRGGIAAGAAAGAVAAIAAYLFDPRRGPRRRALLRDRLAKLRRQTRNAASETARDAANRTRGVLAVARANVMNEPVDDVVLVERVRSRLGRAARHSGAIEVTVADGNVTLTGPVLSQDAAAVRLAARHTRGVREVDDRLTVHSSAEDVPQLQGPGRIPESEHDFGQRSWAPTTRLIATVGGGALIAYGMARRGLRGTLAAGIGAGMALRGATNLELGRALGVAGGRRAVDIHKTIVVGAPLSDVFGVWSRFAEFPRFMGHVHNVETNPDGTYRWHVSGPAGAPIVFDAQVTKLIPDETIAWKSLRGEAIRHSGIVRLEQVDTGTRVTVRMSYNPPAGVVGHAVNTLFGTDPKTALDEDLLRFKSLLEEGRTSAGGTETRVEEVTAAPPSAGLATTEPTTKPKAQAQPRAQTKPKAQAAGTLLSMSERAKWIEPEAPGLMPADVGIDAPLEPGAAEAPPELTEPVPVEAYPRLRDARIREGGSEGEGSR